MPARNHPTVATLFRGARWPHPGPLDLRPPRAIDLFDAWLFAENEAALALGDWSAAPTELKGDAHAVYVAALDREAQAADVLRQRLSA
jgi:hypothetical protein